MESSLLQDIFVTTRVIGQKKKENKNKCPPETRTGCKARIGITLDREVLNYEVW
jgi:hypothetical protein